MTLETLSYASNTDPNRRKRKRVFLGMWVVYCLALGLASYAAWTAHKMIASHATITALMPGYFATPGWFPWFCVGICLATFVFWGMCLFRLRRIRRMHPARFSRAYAGMLCIIWLQFGYVAVQCFLLAGAWGHWGWPGIAGCICSVMILIHIPRLSQLWPVQQGLTSPPPPSPPAHR